MKIFVDADATPKAVKEIIFRAVERTKVETIFVANRSIRLPESPYLKMVIVPHGMDVADDHIVAMINSEDLVITADIPLASEVIAKKALAINPRGETYTQANISQRLSMRDMMSELRSSGIETGGPSAYSQRNAEMFANALNRWLTKNLKR